jgi:hypothetical protein
MDPISALGAVASAVQLAQIALGPVVEYFKAVKDARTDILSLTASLSSLHAVIHEIEAREDSKNSALHLLTKVMNPDEETPNQITPLGALGKEMNRLRAKLDTARSGASSSPFRPRGSVTLKQKLLWPFKAGEVSRTIKMIEYYKSLFTVAFSAETA